jgi:hypothetical protein
MFGNHDLDGSLQGIILVIATTDMNPICDIIIIIIIIIIKDFSLFGVCPSNKHCPSARCAYAANAVGKDLDIFAVGAVSDNHICTHQTKIVNNICSCS